MNSVLEEMRQLLASVDGDSALFGRDLKKGMKVKIDGITVKIAKVTKNKIGRAIEFSVEFMDAGEGFPQKNGRDLRSKILSTGETLEKAP
jgi:hypothetical protein